MYFASSLTHQASNYLRKEPMVYGTDFKSGQIYTHWWSYVVTPKLEESKGLVLVEISK